MTRNLLLISGGVLILILLAVWVYLLIFGRPGDGEEVFSNLGIVGSGGEESILPSDNTGSGPIIDATPEAPVSFRQLTTRRAAGFEFASPSLRFVEQGTGHIYEIGLTDQTETQISNTTSPQTAEATFSSNADLVGLIAYRNYQSEALVGTIESESGSLENSFSLPPDARNLAFNNQGNVLYTVTENGRTTGYQYNRQEQIRREVFNLPMTEISLLWGADNAVTYLYTKPTNILDGYLYEVDNNQLTPIGRGAPALLAMSAGDQLVRTFSENGRLRSTISNLDGSNTRDLPLTVIPEKCAFASDMTALWCGGSISGWADNFVEAWYKGTTAANDALWRINLETLSAELHLDLFNSAGQQFDVDDIAISSDQQQIVLRNKLDNSLWLYNRQF